MQKIAAALLSGILLFCSFPPLEYYSFAWVALVPLIYLCFYCRPGKSFLYGLLSGGVFWLGSIFWLTRVSFIGWFFIGLYCAFYLASFALVVSWWHDFMDGQPQADPPMAENFKNAAGPEARALPTGFSDSGQGRAAASLPRRLNLMFLFGVPALWVALEYARAQFLTGFPWNLLGVSQYASLPLIQCADWGGVYLVSYLIIMGNTSLALMIYHCRGGILKPAIGLVSFLLILFLALQYGNWRLSQSAGKLETIRTAAVQSNVPQQLKWSEEWAGDIYRRLKMATEEACRAAPSDLIVWPETALPDFLRSSGPSRDLVNGARRHNVPLLVGSMDLEELPEKTNYYNSSFLFLPRQNVSCSEAAKAAPAVVAPKRRFAEPRRRKAPPRREGVHQGVPCSETQRILLGVPQVYAKRHLVLFGEYVPFADYFPFLRSISGVEEDFTPGKENVIFRLGGDNMKFSVLICFEDILPFLARECVKAGARLLINQTNDAWFDPSWASRQHMTHCVFRCIENRVACLRATNTGLTCYIDRFGFIRSSLPPLGHESHEPQVMRSKADFSPGNMPLTFYTRHGDLFALACAAFSLPFFIGTLLGFLRKR